MRSLAQFARLRAVVACGFSRPVTKHNEAAPSPRDTHEPRSASSIGQRFGPLAEDLLEWHGKRYIVDTYLSLLPVNANMLPLELQTPGEIARSLAARVRALRLHRGWTQEETAQRSGLTLATYRRFERTGRIALERLLRIAVVLDARTGFDQLFELPPARSLAEMQRALQPTRRRGRRLRADD